MRALYRNNRGETYLKEVEDPTLGKSGVLIDTMVSVLGTGSEVGGVAKARRAMQAGWDPGPLSEGPMSYQSAGRVVAVTRLILSLTMRWATGWWRWAAALRRTPKRRM